MNLRLNKAAWEQHRAERKARFEQIQKACEGKAVGQTVNVQVGDKTLKVRMTSALSQNVLNHQSMHLLQ